MKKVIFTLILLILSVSLCYGGLVVWSGSSPLGFWKSPDTDSHQGYTTDGTFHYTFDTLKIWKRNDDSTWSEDSSNANPFTGINGSHLGDGDYYNNKLYITGESWADCNTFSNQQILVYSTSDLSRDSANDISAQGEEVSGLVVVEDDGDNGIIYTVSFCNGSKIWKYDLSDFSFLGTISLSQTLNNVQGLTYKNGFFYISESGGGLYKVTSTGTVTSIYLSIEGGNHEGLDFSQSTLRWMIDGGSNEEVHYFKIKK